jgi:hypothetical protein
MLISSAWCSPFFKFFAKKRAQRGSAAERQLVFFSQPSEPKATENIITIRRIAVNNTFIDDPKKVTICFTDKNGADFGVFIPIKEFTAIMIADYKKNFPEELSFTAPHSAVPKSHPLSFVESPDQGRS